MRFKVVIFCLLAFLFPAIGREILDPGTEDGDQVASRVRSTIPAENGVIAGEFEITRKTRPKYRKVPVVCSVVVQESTWESIYEVTGDAENPPERLVIKHSPSTPNQYFYARAESTSARLPELRPVAGNKVSSVSFAGSDFSISDLGLDFLSWPKQVKIAEKKCLGRPCVMLESCNTAEPEIVRVVSFIDKEVDHPLKAEAYTRDDPKPVKMFSLAGSSFKKVNGRYRLEKIKIENFATGSETILRYKIEQGR